MIFEHVDNVPDNPVLLYEVISYLIIFALMMILYEKRDKDLKTDSSLVLFLNDQRKNSAKQIRIRKDIAGWA